MKEMKGKMVICENEDEAREIGHPIKIYDGHRWLLGILWKTQEMIGTEYFRIAEIETD